ncbi:MAG: flagellar M-ring protein FliF, partial [Rhodospirillales bacterium]|nr:flagellar M-ring protein FliF [Rhodospirillales bacterium]
MDTFLQALRSLGPLRLSVIGVVIIGLIGFFIYLVTRLSTPQMALLYSNMEPSDTTRIAQQLDASNTPYEIRVNGTQVYVPADRVETLRLTTAEQGLTGGALPGYEIFDDADALGSTNFIQNVNLVRALEGELARTIRSIESVKSARVHLVMPKRELFSREKQQPTASVILKMKGANRLDKNQIAAVQQLIATAVPGLSPNHISVVDDRGTLLARGFEEEGAAGSASTKIEEKRRAFELRTVKTIEELLEKTVGFGRVRAEVTAEMDFDRIVTNEVSFDPDGQVVRSTQSIEETASSREAEGTPPVSVATNLPDAQSAGGENAGSTAAESRTEETVNFEITKKETNHVREAGVVKRLSVAVLIDGNYTTNEGGERTYQPRAEAEMELLATLVRGAIGFNADRGDTVEVINMQFAEIETEKEEAFELFFGLNKKDLLRMAEILVLSIVAILVILLVVRPLVTRALEAMPAAVAAMPEALLAEQAQAAITGPGGVPVPSDGAPA